MDRGSSPCLIKPGVRLHDLCPQPPAERDGGHGNIGRGSPEIGLSFFTAMRAAHCSERVISIHYLPGSWKIGPRLCIRSGKKETNYF